MKSFFKSKKAISAIIIIFICIIVFLIIQRNKPNHEQNQQEAERVPLVDIVKVGEYQSGNSFISAIGVVESQDQVELKSEISSTVKNIYVHLGDTVSRGQLLVELNHDTLDAQLNQAASGINRAQGNLDQQLAGATDENKNKAQASVDQAKANLDQAQAQFQNTKISSANRLQNAKLSLDQARTDLLNSDATTDQTLHTTYDSALNAGQTALSQIKSSLITLTDIQYKYFSCFNSTICSNISDSKSTLINTVYGKPNSGRYNLETVSNLNGGLVSLFENSSITQSQIKESLPKIKQALNELEKLVQSIQVGLGSSLATNATDAEKSAAANIKNIVAAQLTAITNADNAIQNSSLSKQTTKDSTQVAYEKALENYNAAVKQVEEDERVAQSMVDSAQAALLQAQAGYDSVVAGPRDVDLKGFKASVQESQASYQLISANREKAFIRAPFDGVVAVLPVKAGELVSPGTRIISIVNNGGLQVSAYINERDRALIAEGTRGVVEDAYESSVVHIAPSVDPQTRKVRVISVLNDTDQENNLLIDQYVRIKFEAQDNEAQNTYLLPLTAIKTTTRGSYIFTIENEQNSQGVLKELEISVGRIIGENIEVQGGVDSEILFVTNVRGLKNGDMIRIAE